MAGIKCFLSILVVIVVSALKTYSATVVWPAMELYPYGIYGNVYGGLLNSTVPSYIAGVEFSISSSGAVYVLQGQTATAATGIFLYQAFGGDAVDVNSLAAATPLAENLTAQFGSIEIALDEAFYLCFWMGGQEELAVPAVSTAGPRWSGTARR